jgi:hypothetical protein
MESVETEIPTEKRSRAPSQESCREGRVQHGEEELLPVRHDHTPAERLDHETEAHQEGPGQRAAQVDQRRQQDGQAHALAHLLGPLERCARERLLASARRGLRAGDEARARSPQPRPRDRGQQAHGLVAHRGRLVRSGLVQQMTRANPTCFSLSLFFVLLFSLSLSSLFFFFLFHHSSSLPQNSFCLNHNTKRSLTLLFF